MSPRSKREPTVIADDPESRGAGEVETLPVPEFDVRDFVSFDATPEEHERAKETAKALIEGRIGNYKPPTDSTGTLLGDNATVESMLAYKEVSVTELFEDGSRGIRMYLGKPSFDTFDVMRRRSKGIGVVIEAEGVSVEHVK